MDQYYEPDWTSQVQEERADYQEPEEYYATLGCMEQDRSIPYYQSHPKQQKYLEEWEYERDFEKMKRLYPERAKMLQGYIEEECDKMEYEGSRMFDAYPDKTVLKQICVQIAEKIHQDEDKMDNEQKQENLPEPEEQIEQELELLELSCKKGNCPNTRPDHRPDDRPDHRPGHRPDDRPDHRPGHRPHRPDQDSSLMDLLEVLLYNEMYQRRCRHHRCKRYW